MNFQNQAISSTEQKTNLQSSFNGIQHLQTQFPVQMNTFQIPTQVSVPTEFFIYDPKTGNLTQLNPANIQFDPVTGLAIAPPNYTAIYTPAPQYNYNFQSKLQIPSTINVQASSSQESNSAFQSASSTRSRGHTPEPVHQHQNTMTKPKRKFPHRSKQVRIQEVHNEVAFFFKPKGLYAFSETEVLRGEDTCRVHVKTYQGLNQILDVLKEVYEHPKVELKRIATPISMKNRYQKKGFIVYMKLADVKQVPIVQAIFEKYKDLYKKCDVAKPKTDQNLPTKTITKPLPAISTINKDSGNTDKILTMDLNMFPRAMTKQASVGA